MLIKVDHPEYRGIELVGESLVIHFMHGESRTLQEQVKDVAVAIQNGTVQIVAFLDKDYAWFYRGAKELEHERVELGQMYGGGGKLITDGVGNCHLFYFVKQSPGHSVLLRHQTFYEKWSSPMTVSTNVFAQGSSFSAAWHSDNYLHIVYCNHRDQHLLYRVFDLEHRTWSGAVPFSTQSCSLPQFIVGERLYLFWQEDGKKISLKVRDKGQAWSSPIQVSDPENHVASVGYSIEKGQWHVLWSEGSEFFQAPFDKWSERQKVEREYYTYAWVARDGLLTPLYETVEAPPQSASQPQPQPQPKWEPEPLPEETFESITPPQLGKRAREEREERKVQEAFLEQAFRTIHEWESFRDEIRHWQTRFTPPEPVDLNPITARIDRLERRMFNLQQGQEQQKQTWESRLDQLQLELARTQRRVTATEEVQKKRPVSLWRRVLGRS